VKPENILLTEDGMTLLADFGIARCLRRPSGEHLTEAGHGVGTPTYMAPEQAMAEPADSRADQYALAAMCYEMIAGSPPHAGPTLHAVIARRFATTAPGVRTHRSEVSITAERALQRALSLRADDRFGTIAEFSKALTQTAPIGYQPRWQVPRIAWIALSIALALVVVLLVWPHLRESSDGATTGGSRVLAVLPFENLGDTAGGYFAAGLTDEVRGKLSQVPGLEVIARGSSSQYYQSSKGAEEITRELGANYLLSGTVRWERGPDGGSRVRVIPELVEIRPGHGPRTRWQEPFDAALTSVFDLQAEIADKVVSALGVALADSIRGTLASRPTASLSAYDAFLKGEAASQGVVANDPPSLRRALVFYEEAVALDPSFVPAWAQLARTSAQLFGSGAPTKALADKARVAAERAVALGPGRPEGYLALGAYYRGVLGDSRRALATYESGLRLAPNHVDLLAASGVAEQVAGHWDSALSRFKRAATLDPRSARAVRRYAGALLNVRRYAEADQESDRALGLAPTNVGIYQTKVLVAVARGDMDEARRLVRTAPAGIDPTELIVYFATFEDLWWVLDDAQQRRLLTLPPSAFDESHATWGLVLAQVLHHRGDARRSRAYADSAVLGFQQHVREAPNDGQAHALFGLALAYAGRATDAVREGERGLKLQPLSRDGFIGPYLQQVMARIYLLIGDQEKALDQLEPLLQVPHTLSPGWLRIDPTWDALRQQPRFRRLVEGA
jgi:TolB-like protein/Flp pilus assembly protein TadD